MDLLQRYLDAVATRLPDTERADIVAELRETLLSQIEDRQARLHRMLTEADITALLKDYGHPLIVAARYRPQPFLVRAELFPFFWITLQLVLGLVVAAHLALAVIALVMARDVAGRLWSTWGSLWIVSMY